MFSMKILFLLVFSILFFFSAGAQTNSGDWFRSDSTCYRLWWVDNKMGGYDGFEFRKNGEVKLLNYDLFTGEKWWTKGDHLYVEIRSKKSGKVHKTDYLIKNQSVNSLLLSYTMLDQSFTDRYEALTSGDFTDKLLGHWDGENGTYIQIVPKSSFQFQLVLSDGTNRTPEKVDGFLDEQNARIVFYLEQEGKEITLFFEAGKETITIAGKSYSRKCPNR
jgi:hypothetical protein